ncbi:MAG: flagellar biosynthetic protein FliO [Alphaproteobacteria bacterium]|nr:flagellar biosynthetic protein FliO [Alphaproteobacteria bacterium]
MDMDILRLLLSLGVVLGLMWGLAFFIKKLGLAGAQPVQKSGKKDLEVVESLFLDARRRAVILRYKDKEHLVILGANSETLIETRDVNPDQSA